MIGIVSGPPPIPVRARNRGTGAQLANATVATNLSLKAVLAFIGIFLGFVALLLMLSLLGIA